MAEVWYTSCTLSVYQRATNAVTAAIPAPASAGPAVQPGRSQRSVSLDTRRDGLDTKRDSLTVTLARAIAAGDYPPGSPLIERSVAEDFGSSRTPVREALRDLEYQGLVVRFPGKGTFVAPLSSQDVEEVFFLREVLETTAARLAVPRIPEESVLEAQRQMEAFHPPFTPEIARQFREVDYSLHDLFLRHCGNRRLNELLRQLRPQIDRVRYTLTEFDTSRDEHLAIIEHLLARDVDAVVESLAAHLRSVKVRALEFCRLRY